MGSFTSDGETNTDAVIFSKDDLVFNGLGKLAIASNDNAISGKDDIKFTGGTYEITAKSDAVEANDSILICGGDFTITALKDAFHAENEEDASLGYICIIDGTFTLRASSDGIQGNTFVQIDGGTFDITSSEGIEATYVQINGGTINISASDDGINAASKSNAYTPTVEFNGGYTTITMSSGDVDGVDANGNIYVNGGTVEVNMNASGMAEPFDFDGKAELNGGTVIVNGEQWTSITSSAMGGGFGGGGFGGGRNGGGGRRM